MAAITGDEADCRQKKEIKYFEKRSKRKYKQMFKQNKYLQRGEERSGEEGLRSGDQIKIRENDRMAKRTNSNRRCGRPHCCMSVPILNR